MTLYAAGTWYPPGPTTYDPSAGTGGFLSNPPFAIMPLSNGDTLWRTPRHEPFPHWEVTVHRANGGNLPVLVRFLRHGRMVTTRRIAAWLPTVGAWDQTRWAPNAQGRQVPDLVLSAVELALRGGGA
jgi:hypothetical protein